MADDAIARRRRRARTGVATARRRPTALGCHAGKRRRCSRAAQRRRQERDARAATRRTIPKGPHDQPQSMCPAFGSLRVGLRMRRTATILSGSACCVYGLTFTSHFYGARRTVGYVPFNSETLVTGKLFEDIREAVLRARRPGALRRDRHHQSVRADGVAACRCSCCRRRSTACASSASTCRASACRRMRRPRTCWPARCCSYARTEAEQGPVQRRAAAAPAKPTDHAARRDVPGRSGGHRHDAGADGARPPGPWCRRASGASSTPRSTAPRSPRSIRSTPPACASSTRPAARSSAPRRSATTAPRPGCEAIGEAASVAQATDRRREEPRAARDPRRAGEDADQGPHHAVAATKAPSCWSRACWSRAAPTCATSAPPARARAWSDADREWLEAQGVHVQYRASLEQDLAAMREFAARPRDRHHAGGAGGEGSAASPRSTSPT